MKETEQMVQGIFLFYLFVWFFLFVLKTDFEKLVLFIDSLSGNMVSFHFFCMKVANMNILVST